MTAQSPEDRVRDIAGICYRDCDEAVGIIEFHKAGNTPQAQAAFGEREGHIPNLVWKAMMQRLLMTVMRMYDQPGSDRETLPRAFDVLKDQGVFDAVAEGGDKARLEAARTRWACLSGDSALAALRRLRDFEIAHTIPSKAVVQRATLNEFFYITDESLKLVEDLAAGAGVVSVSFDSARQIWARRAGAYWSRLIT